MTSHESGIVSEPLEGTVPGTIHRISARPSAPGVLFLHGSGGRPLDRQARRLAEEGFVCATIQYFGDADGVPNDLVEVPLETIERAIDRLVTHEAVVGDRIGLYGGSKGGELALLSAARFDGIGAVVSVAGSCYAWEGLTQEWRVTGTSSWSLGGEPIQYVPFPDAEPPGDTIRSYYEFALEWADPSTVESATIPVERIDAPLLLVSGTDDRMWPSETYAETAVDRLERHGYQRTYRQLAYENAGHRIGPPGPWLETLDDDDLRFGGTPNGTRRASNDYWLEVQSLYESALRE
ncbi:acyl-CoA thioester hydrolase/BAAT C-terminal domain-containing protein [Halomontanus rarus]|uniref:acyl-CoA thioester hydrolase/BAAT C-terminal domain-containing protein n=1 Tax=Halomontanus rarus TaxID=3034020 RepID=UPI001A98A32B